jgi:hypothetical protein
MTPFIESTTGRLLLAAAGIALMSGASQLITGSYYIAGVGLPAAITIAFVAVGTGMGDYTKETLFSILLMPPALWGFMYLVGEIGHGGWGWGILLLGIVAFAKAAIPASDEGRAAEAKGN